MKITYNPQMFYWFQSSQYSLKLCELACEAVVSLTELLLRADNKKYDPPRLPIEHDVFGLEIDLCYIADSSFACSQSHLFKILGARIPKPVPVQQDRQSACMYDITGRWTLWDLVLYGLEKRHLQVLLMSNTGNYAIVKEAFSSRKIFVSLADINETF